jgi:hypothetical protein
MLICWLCVEYNVIYLFNSIAGYQNAITIKEIVADDIRNIQTCVAKVPSMIITNSVTRPSISETKLIGTIVFGLYASDPSSFEFQMGEVVLLLEVVKFVRKTLDENENNLAIFNDSQDPETPTVQTVVGLLFGNVKTKIQAANISQSTDNAVTSTSTASKCGWIQFALNY